MSLDRTLGRGQRAKNPNPRYEDSDFIMARGRKGKAPQPKKDEIDVVYDHSGEDICDVKYGTSPDRIPQWIDLIRANYKNLTETLKSGHGKQIKLTEPKWKGTVIELFESGIIMVKGRKGLFVDWAEQEFPSLREKMPPMGLTEKSDNDSIIVNNSLGGSDSQVDVLCDNASEKGLCKADVDMGCLSSRELSPGRETDVKTLSVPRNSEDCQQGDKQEDIHKAQLESQKMDKTGRDGSEHVPAVHRMLEVPQETPLKGNSLTDFGRSDIYRRSPSAPRTPSEKNKEDIGMLKVAIAQLQSCVADIPVIKRMLEAQEGKRNEEIALRKERDRMAQQVATLKGLLEQKTDEGFETPKNILKKDNTRLKKQVSDLQEQLQRQEVTISFLEEQVKQSVGNGERTTLNQIRETVVENSSDIDQMNRKLQDLVSVPPNDIDEPPFSILKAAIDANKSVITDIDRKVTSLVETQESTITDIIKTAVNDETLLTLPPKDNTRINQTPLHSQNHSQNQHRRDDTIHVRSNTVNIVMSDSMSRDVKEADIDPSGKSQVKTFGGFDTLKMTNKIGTFQRNTNITQAIVNVGKNDKVNPLTEQNIQQLIKEIRNKFPKANITFTAVLPGKDGMSENSKKFNRALEEVCLMEEKVGLTNFGPDFLQSDLFVDEIHLNDNGTRLLSWNIKTLLQGLDAVEGEPDEMPQRIETVITDRKEPVTQTHDQEERSYISSKLVKKYGGNEFQAFAAKCSSHEEAMTIRQKIQQETSWKYPPEGQLTSLMWAYSLNGSYRNDNDGERGAGPRIAECMRAIGMDNSIILVARKCGQHIQGRRWTVLQELITEVANKLGYTVPVTLNIHSMFREHGNQWNDQRYDQWNRTPRNQRNNRYRDQNQRGSHYKERNQYQRRNQYRDQTQRDDQYRDQNQRDGHYGDQHGNQNQKDTQYGDQNQRDNHYGNLNQSGSQYQSHRDSNYPNQGSQINTQIPNGIPDDRHPQNQQHGSHNSPQTISPESMFYMYPQTHIAGVPITSANINGAPINGYNKVQASNHAQARISLPYNLAQFGFQHAVPDYRVAQNWPHHEGIAYG